MSRAPSGSGLQLIRTDDFTGGLNLRADAFQLADNESPDLLNVDIDPRGGFTMRPGTTVLTPADGGSWGLSGSIDPRRLLVWNQSDGSKQLLLATGAGLWFSNIEMSGLDFEYVDPVDVDVESTYGPSLAQWSGSGSEVYASTYYTGGASSGFVWNGLAATSLSVSAPGDWQDDLSVPDGTHMPIARFVAAHVDRLWVADTVEDGAVFPNRVRFSHPLFPQSWRELDYIDIVEGGTGITALVPFGGNLVVFKEHAVFLIAGYSTDTFQVVSVSTELGCVNPDAFVEHQGVLYFYDRQQGVVVFDGVRIQGMFSKLAPETSDMWKSDDAVSRISLSSIGRKVFVSMPYGVSATYVLDPTVGNGAWTKYQLSTGAAFGPGVDFDSKATFCDLDRPAVFFLDEVAETDFSENEYLELSASAPFPSYYTTKWLDAGFVSVKKRWRRADIIAHQTGAVQRLDVKVYYDWQEGIARRTIDVDVPVNSNASGLIWGESTWGDSTWGGFVAGSQYVRTAQLGSARAVQLKVGGPGGQKWGVNSITYKYNFRRLRA